MIDHVIMTWVLTVTRGHCSYVVPSNRILLNKQCYLRNWQFSLPCFTWSIFLAFHSLVFLLLLEPAVLPSETHSYIDLSVKQIWDSLERPAFFFCIHQRKGGLTNVGTAAEVMAQHCLQTVASSIVWNATISVSRDVHDTEMPAQQEYKILVAGQDEKFMQFLLNSYRSGNPEVVKCKGWKSKRCIPATAAEHCSS